MDIKTLHIYFVTVFLCFCKFLTAQSKTIDSLSKLNFETFENYFEKQHLDSVNDFVYAKAYLKKAIKVKDTLEIANAYYYLSDSTIPSQGLKYCDSILSLASNSKGKYTFRFFAYIQKSNIYFNLGQYSKALNFALKCYDLSIKENDYLYILISKQNIGLIKNKLGEREEALKIFKSYVDYLEGIDIDDKDYYLINGLYCLADSYVYNKKRDSADLTINKGLEKAIKSENRLMHAHYVYLSGVNSFFSKNYEVSIDSLLRSQLIFKDNVLYATSNLYLGKSYFALNKKNTAVKHFIEVDSFLQKTQNITPELIQVYQPLIEFYKEKGVIKKQFYYINRLLKYDSILSKDNKDMSKSLVKNYYIPNLMSSKNLIINQLKNKNNIAEKYIYLLVLIAMLFLISTTIYIRKNLLNKKKFNTILSSQNNDKNKPIALNESIEINNNAIDLSNRVINDILLKLEMFENKNKFIKYYTLTSLAKELKTNSSYLSKIINTTKGCNFSNYLNNLRINYAINKLTIDKKFRSYTIRAIAKDCGFNTAQSFSNAFYKKTGLKPSYFIKKVEKRENVDN